MMKYSGTPLHRGPPGVGPPLLFATQQWHATRPKTAGELDSPRVDPFSRSSCFRCHGGNPSPKSFFSHHFELQNSAGKRPATMEIIFLDGPRKHLKEAVDRSISPMPHPRWCEATADQ